MRNCSSYSHQYEYTIFVTVKKFILLCVDTRQPSTSAASSENHRVTLRRQKNLLVGEVRNCSSYSHQYEYTKIVIAKKFELLCVDSRMSTSPAASSENHRVTLRRQKLVVRHTRQGEGEKLQQLLSSI